VQPQHASGLVPASAWLRRMPQFTLAVFLVPIGAGLLGTALPAFGWLPGVDSRPWTLAP
jgi:putative thiamine transport system permease protein